jgi:hypothetical protein
MKNLNLVMYLLMMYSQNLIPMMHLMISYAKYGQNGKNIFIMLFLKLLKLKVKELTSMIGMYGQFQLKI